MQHLQRFKERYYEVTEGLMTASAAKNGQLYNQLIKEYNFLSPLYKLITTIEDKYNEIQSYISIIRSINDNGEKQQYVDEARKIHKQIAQHRTEISDSLRKTVPVVQLGNDNEPAAQEEQATERRSKIFSSAIGKIQGKDWTLIKTESISSIPIISEAGRAPEETIDKMSELENLFKQIRSAEKSAQPNERLNIVFDKPMPIVARQYCFHQGLFLLHKASHILSAAELHCDQGILSWSLSSAYQSAFLGVKSILYLLGLAIVPFENDFYLLDLWRKIEKEDQNITAGIIRFNYKIGHRNIWELFTRILNSYTIDVWPREITERLAAYSEQDFAKQRNELHYWSASWLYDDLHQFQIDPTFGYYPNGIKTGLAEFQLQSDFSLVLAQVILNLGIRLIDDISTETNAIRLERELIYSFLRNHDRHPIYNRNSF